ncbi:MAG: hypothetical protein U9R50_09160 [Campylobacterota bacterium]|nr:hypothetical protein [Campylobacterota bacterium]
MQSTALNILKTGSNVFITGSAGIAASHLHGQTIHSFFSLGIRSEIDDYYIETLSFPNPS